MKAPRFQRFNLMKIKLAFDLNHWFVCFLSLAPPPLLYDEEKLQQLPAPRIARAVGAYGGAS